MSETNMKFIAKISSDFPTKFGIPRQSGLVDAIQSTIIFEPEFREKNALRGLENFSHIWIIWNFSESQRTTWSPTVRPPRLGGNTRLGVFATRSPFRPNPIGLSCVKLIGLEETDQFGTVIHVAGADLMDGTPIYDIKPYIPYADSHPDAIGGFTDTAADYLLDVDFPDNLLEKIPESKRDALKGVLSHDPRPSYQNDPDRIYGLTFSEYDIKFIIRDNRLTVINVKKI